MSAPLDQKIFSGGGHVGVCVLARRRREKAVRESRTFLGFLENPLSSTSQLKSAPQRTHVSMAGRLRRDRRASKRPR